MHIVDFKYIRSDQTFNIESSYPQLIYKIRKISGHLQEICRDLVNSQGNIPRPGTVPHFSDLEIVALSLSMESIGLDSENYLFSKLREYSECFSHLISRRQFNNRRKFLSDLCSTTRKKIVNEINEVKTTFVWTLTP